MTQHPSEAQKLRAEIAALLRSTPSSSPPSQSAIDSLPYLENFVREVLRVRCPAINMPREAVEDVVVQGVTIPKGTTVIM